MAANLTGNSQKYDASGIRIFQGLRPDIVAIQEFNYAGNSAAEIRQFVTTAFGPDFFHFREAGAQIPNGIISRWPIVASGEWPDPQVSNRDFVWARLDLPGPDDLYVVSVHLHSSGGANSRRLEAEAVKTRVTANFPAGAYVIVAGDLNVDSRSEAALDVFKTFLVDNPVPTDQAGDPDTNNPRSKPYDYILSSANWRTNHVPLVLGAGTAAERRFTNGLVFDSRVFAPLPLVAPVQAADSANAQHMAVLKDFRLQATLTNWVELTPPTLAFDGTQLRWHSPPGLTWRIQTGTNFLDWTDLATASAMSTNYAFSLTATPGVTALLRVVYP